MIGVTVTGVQHVRGNLTRARTGIRTAQERGVAKSSLLVSRMLKIELSEPGGNDSFWGKTGSRGNGLAVRSGHTRAGITPGGTVIRLGDNVVAAVGSGSEALKRHEKGGTFRGTSPSGYSRIPTRAAQTGAGVDRNAGQSIKAIAGAFLFRSSKGLLWAAVRTYQAASKTIRGKGQSKAFMAAQNERIGKSVGGLMLLYLLVKHYTLKPRHIFQRTRDKASPQVTALVGNAVSLVVREANS